MKKCKVKNCENEAVEGKRHCRFHRAKKEDIIAKIGKLGMGVLGLGIIKNIKDWI